MAATRIDQLTHGVEHLLAERELAEWSDHRLLERFIQSRDGAAFETLLHRHGPLVLRVCRGALRDGHDAEDAFQATFLILACNAARIRNPSSLASYLHGTAYRVAVKARARALRRRTAEREAAPLRTAPLEAEQTPAIPEATLHEELGCLPEKYRQVLVLCYLQGRTHEQVARELGWPIGSISRHLRRGCELLRERLVGRGVALSVAGSLVSGMATPLSAAVPTALAQATLQAVASDGAGSVLAAELAREVLKTMNTVKTGRLAALVLLIGILASGTAMLARSDPAPPEKQPAPAPAAAGADRFGDPLPPGAVARLGTTRLRPGGPISAMAFAPDGKTLLATTDTGSLTFWDIPGGRELARLPGQQYHHNAIAFSPDGKQFAAPSEDGTILVRDFLPTGKDLPVRKRFPGEPQTIGFLAFGPDGIVVSAVGDGRITLWDTAGEKALRRFVNPLRGYHATFALSPDRKLLAAASEFDNEVALWDVKKGDSPTVRFASRAPSSLAFSPDGKTLAIGSDANTIRLWELESRKVTGELIPGKEPRQAIGVPPLIGEKHPEPGRSLAFTPDGKTLAARGQGDGTIRLWDVTTGKEIQRLQGAFGDGEVLTFAPDGRTLAASSANHTIRLWDATTGKELDADLGSQGRVAAVAVSPDSKVIAVAATDGSIRLWDRATNREVQSFRGDQRTERVARVRQDCRARNRYTLLSFSPDGAQLIVTGDYDSARVWDVKTGKEVPAFDGWPTTVKGVSQVWLSPDGKRLAVRLTDDRRLLRLLNPATGEVERTLERESSLDRLLFSPDGKLLVGGGCGREMRAWDPATGDEKWSFKNNSSVDSLALTPDGRTVVAGCYTEIAILDAATGKELKRVAVPHGEVHVMAVSPDGRLLAAAGDSGLVTLYEVAAGKPARTLAGHTGHVWALAFAPDGRSLVSGSWDGTALVWDLTSQWDRPAERP